MGKILVEMTHEDYMQYNRIKDRKEKDFLKRLLKGLDEITIIKNQTAFDMSPRAYLRTDEVEKLIRGILDEKE